MKSVTGIIKRLGRAFMIVVMVVAGSTMLMRFAPGYLSDAREMDSRYGDAARQELSAEALRSATKRKVECSGLRIM